MSLKTSTISCWQGCGETEVPSGCWREGDSHLPKELVASCEVPPNASNPVLLQNNTVLAGTGQPLTRALTAVIKRDRRDSRHKRTNCEFKLPRERNWSPKYNTVSFGPVTFGKGQGFREPQLSGHQADGAQRAERGTALGVLGHPSLFSSSLGVVGQPPGEDLPPLWGHPALPAPSQASWAAVGAQQGWGSAGGESLLLQRNHPGVTSFFPWRGGRKGQQGLQMPLRAGARASRQSEAGPLLSSEVRTVDPKHQHCPRGQQAEKVRRC